MKQIHRFSALILCLFLTISFTGCFESIKVYLQVDDNESTNNQPPDKEQDNDPSLPGTEGSKPVDGSDPMDGSTPVDGSQNDPNPPVEPPKDDPLPTTPFITIPHIPLSVSKGELILVNKEYRFDATLAATDLVLIKKSITDPNLAKDLVTAKYEMYLTAQTVDALAHLSHDMQTALPSDKNLHIYSAYRDASYQQSLIDEYMADPKYGPDYVAKYVAPVGASEHHTGLAVDVNFFGDNGGAYSFSDKNVADEYKWLKDNAHKYGLIWRYTEEKTALTGYGAEIWHMRYVGKPHAEYISANNLCLEEYHTLISKATFDSPLVITTAEGAVYSVYADFLTDGLQVPQSMAYTISGSNCGYYVVTVEGAYEDAGIVYPESSDAVELPPAPDKGDKYVSRLTFLADTQIAGLKNSVLLKNPGEKVWGSATDMKLNFKLINTLAVMVDVADGDRYWVSHTIDKTAEHFKPDILVISIGLDGGVNREYALTDSETAEIWRTLISSILKASPDTVILLQSVLPLGENTPYAYRHATNDAINLFNSTMLHVATELHAETDRVFFLDTACALRDEATGYLRSDYTDDGVSLNDAGLVAMMQFIRTHPYID
ncbi:MAG: hypothetical protein E7599_04565 [Ruminococcaceae bacterium]|nr:hypothetical protein [Oscillospiraceae bacterium]